MSSITVIVRVYVLRKPDSFWILDYNKVTQNWDQKDGPIKVSDLFQDLADGDSINSIFSIPFYTKCGLNEENCRNNNRNFDPTDTTIVFYNENKYSLFRRVESTQFDQVISVDTTIPFGAIPGSEHSIPAILGPIYSRIGSALVSPPPPPALQRVSYGYDRH